MRVLYITGWCRTGSTLLGNLLGELDGVVHVGELAYLWANGVLRTGTNTTCGCGADLLGCPVWTKVVDRLTPSPATYAAARIAAHDAHLRTRHTRARLRSPGPALAPMVDGYTAITEVTGSDIIVDSSKFPAEAAALLSLDDVQVLHLVRDPRATAYSWRRAKAYIPAMGVARSTAYWTGFNLASDWIGAAYPDRYLRIRYEDFAARPASVFAEITSWASLPGTPFTGEASAVLGDNHTVTGNPDRLRRGEVHIRPDEAWVEGLPAGETALSTALSLPLLHRYGYSPLRSAGRS